MEYVRYVTFGMAFVPLVLHLVGKWERAVQSTCTTRINDVAEVSPPTSELIFKHDSNLISVSPWIWDLWLFLLFFFEDNDLWVALLFTGPFLMSLQS